MENKSRILVLATGSKVGGGSGFENLVKATLFHAMHPPILNAKIVAVVSNYKHGGVAERAERMGIPFYYWSGPYDAEGYKNLVAKYRADFVALSGWLKLVKGLDPTRTINIHPGPLPKFGGTGLYGHYVHEAVMKDYREGDTTNSAVTMHFVDSEYDKGPQFLAYPVEIYPSDTVETLGNRVNEFEHKLQPWITNLIVTGQITWDGKGPVMVPVWYKALELCPKECVAY